MGPAESDAERGSLEHVVERLLSEQCETNRLLRELIAEQRARRRAPAKRQATIAKKAPGKVRVADPVLRRQMRQQLKQRFGQ